MADRPMDRSTATAHGDAAKYERTPQACRWGDSTLYTPFPEWLSAWDAPWACRHPAHKGPLETTETCAACPDWRPRDHSS